MVKLFRVERKQYINTLVSLPKYFLNVKFAILTEQDYTFYDHGTIHSCSLYCSEKS